MLTNNSTNIVTVVWYLQSDGMQSPVCDSPLPKIKRMKPIIYSRVAAPGPGEPQGALDFTATQQFIDQWKQWITRLTRLTWFLGLNWLQILGWKQKPAHPAVLRDQERGPQHTLRLSGTRVGHPWSTGSSNYSTWTFPQVHWAILS